MLNFAKNYMESIEGVATYPMISLLIFFVFFALLFWWVLTAKKEYIKEVSELPLENDNQPKEPIL
jgi:hypothetical protein